MPFYGWFSTENPQVLAKSHDVLWVVLPRVVRCLKKIIPGVSKEAFYLYKYIQYTQIYLQLKHPFAAGEAPSASEQVLLKKEDQLAGFPAISAGCFFGWRMDLQSGSKSESNSWLRGVQRENLGVFVALLVISFGFEPWFDELQDLEVAGIDS